MNSKILLRFILLLIPVVLGVFCCIKSESWWFWGLMAVLLSVSWLEAIDERARATRSKALARWRSWTMFFFFLAMLTGTIMSIAIGRSWWFTLLLSVVVLFLWWSSGLPDADPEPREPEFDPKTPPGIPFETALFRGSDAEFTWYVNEHFPVMDWKDMADSVISEFQPHVPRLRYAVDRDCEPSNVTLVHDEKMQTFELKAAPEAGQVMEELPRFLAPEFVVCSYKFTEGSDTWVNPVFTAELWQRLQKERPDRAALFTPLFGG